LKNLITKFAYLFLILIIVIVFRNWFTFGIIASGDWNFRFEDQIRGFTIFPYIWTYLLNNIGGNNNVILGLHTYFFATTAILFKYFNLSWIVIERLVWFWSFIFISFFSSWYLSKTIMPDNKFSFLSPFIFIFNTYILMIVGGGQMGVAMAYAIAPLALIFFIKMIDETRFNPKLSMLSGLILSAQLIFDSRMSYVTVVSILIYFIFSQFGKGSIKDFIKKFIISLVAPGIMTFLIHAFWLIPLLIVHQNPLQQFGEAYSTVGAVKYFSFANFEQTISLLHPYWPENIFGKIGFMKPEFLVVPILAYSSLVFVRGLANLRKKRYVMFFALLGLIGAFLAKGANGPFGNIYLLAFNYVPGFVLFRDPTKWYLLVVISYSILTPFSIWKIFEWLKSKKNFSINSKIFNFQNAFLLFVLFYLLLIIKPAWMNQLTGTFKQYNISQDYIKLENFLSKDKRFYRTFWVPSYERFGFRSDTHPAISGQDFIKKYNSYNVARYLIDKNSQIRLQDLAVRYVIVPSDLQGEIFLNDRKYDNIQYLKTIEYLDGTSFLKKVEGFGKIKVFEVPNSKDHLWSPNKDMEIKYENINPTKYEVGLENVKKSDALVFSESFDKNWVAYNPEFKIQSLKFNNRFNSFILPKKGDYSLTIFYTPQRYVVIGLWISGATLLGILLYLLLGIKFKKNYNPHA